MKTIVSASPPVSVEKRRPGRRFHWERLGCFLWLAALLCPGLPARSATNDAVATLQQGLFDEEANHDLNAAIQRYQNVVARFDQDRRLAATALFRLGECYRKQGNTNQANAEYERVVREFPDQVQFAALSRAYLAASGQGQALTNAAAAASTSAEAEEVQRITAMIKDSPDLINARDAGTGQTPLHSAASKGELTVARFLLANGAEVDARNPRFADRIPLHFAAAAGHKAMVELLLDHHANLEAADNSGFTPLHLAAQQGFRTVIETLLTRGTNVNAQTGSKATPLHFAAANGFKAIAEILLAHGADPNIVAAEARSSTSQVFVGAPLHIAADRGDSALAELLLANRANVNLPDNSGPGFSPLHVAATRGNLAVAKVLLAHGAEVNAQSRGPSSPGATPLTLAVSAAQKEMVALLLKNGADPDAPFRATAGSNDSLPDANLSPAVVEASRKGLAEILDLLLAAGADANLKRTNGDSPLFACLAADQVTCGRMVAALLDHRANVNTRDFYAATLLMRAAERRRKELAATILAHKPDVNAQDLSGNSALHYLIFSLRSMGPAASQNGPVEDAPAIAEAIIVADAYVNSPNREGRTPLGLIQNPRPPQNPSVTGLIPRMEEKIAEILRQHGALAELPDLDSIRLTRAGLGSSYAVFHVQTNRLNRFTVMETLASFYLSGEGNLSTRGFGPPMLGMAQHVPLEFPDFSRVKILRPIPGKLAERQPISLNLLTPADTFDCSKDVALEFGDVIELPEREHPLSERSVGLTSTQQIGLLKCLGRKVTVVVKGQRLDLDLDGGHPNCYLSLALGMPQVQAFLRSSSDLSHLLIKRPASDPGGAGEIPMDVVPFWNNKMPLSDDLWLRNGDVIEVPDKP